MNEAWALKPYGIDNGRDLGDRVGSGWMGETGMIDEREGEDTPPEQKSVMRGQGYGVAFPRRRKPESTGKQSA